MLSSFHLFPLLDLLKRIYAFPFMPFHYFSGLFILANYYDPPLALLSLYRLADRDNDRTGDGVENFIFSGLYAVAIPQYLSSFCFQRCSLYS